MSTESFLLLAERHLAEGQARVDRQRALVDRLDAGGHDTVQAKELLAVFEKTLASMAADLAFVRERMYTASR